MRAGSKNLNRYAEAKLKQRLTKVSSTLRRAAKHAEDAEHIHDVRVAVRRFTQGLRIFKDLLDRSRTRKMRRKLKKIMDLCAAVRNCDVALEVLHPASAHGIGAVERHLRKARSHAERSLADSISGSKAAKMKDWEDWLTAEAGPAQTIASAARRALVPLARQFFKARAGTAKLDCTMEELHRFRLTAKRLRYTLEIFGPVAGAGWSGRIGEIRALQEHLGGINDCVATRDLIGDPSYRGAGVHRSKAALERLLRQRVQAFREHLDGHFGAADARMWLAEFKKIE